MKTDASAVVDENLRLQQRLHFDEKDLDENRQGRLTPRQKRHLWIKINWRFSVFFQVFFAVGVIPLFLIAPNDEAKSTYLILVGPLVLILILASLGVVFHQQYELYRDISSGLVIRHEGHISPSVYTTHTYTFGPKFFSSYTLGIITTKQEFLILDVTKQVLQAFQASDIYVLYYTPVSKTLVAAQHLRHRSPPRIGTPHKSVRPPRISRRERRKTQHISSS